VYPRRDAWTGEAAGAAGENVRDRWINEWHVAVVQVSVGEGDRAADNNRGRRSRLGQSGRRIASVERSDAVVNRVAVVDGAERVSGTKVATHGVLPRICETLMPPS
jgi:hypothetical protein